MVKKLILKIGDDNLDEKFTVDNLINKNKLLQDTVTKYKEKITYYHNNKSWDKYKKLSNEYELIFTTPNTGTNISNYNPVSRSFFKLWEILNDFDDIIFKKNNAKYKSLFLAEGPGGFSEAFIKYRIMKGFKDDEYHGITLKSNNDKNIPEWKLQKDIMKKLKIYYGIDNTGNLYNYDNILYLTEVLKENSVDFITADGGFDFSLDFNAQENVSFKLILCEIMASIKLQKKGGIFILKIFDMFTEYTLKLVQIIKEYYKELYIIKPLTSRPANSEKYLLFVNFNNTDKEDLTNKLENLVKNYSNETKDIFFKNIEYNAYILHNLVLYNLEYSIKQVFYIQQTIDYINYFNENKNDSELNEILNKHIKKSRKWCSKYYIPIDF